MNCLEFQAVKELEKLGWETAHKGWPDLLLFRNGPYGLELMAAEVKSKNDKVRPEQQLILEKLAAVMPVYVLRECADGQLREHRINQRG